MWTLIVAVFSFFAFIVAYHTYGRWLSKRIFNLDKDALVPSKELQDDIDFVPTKKEVIFGHHFTSIAGTGPIVGPAIAVFWGWLPALLWVVLGSIFIGAVHDFGALIISMRNRGQTVGEVAGRLISPRAKILFLIVLALALTIVLAIFGLVIAVIFREYPESVLSVWIEIPIAIAIGYWVYKKGGGLLLPSIAALAIMYIAIYVGVYYFPIDLGSILGMNPDAPKTDFYNPIVIWTVILLGYCFVASILPVWTLLQPRDYINSHQLVLALGLLVLGLFVASFTGEADLVASAPMIADDIPDDAPPIFPFLFITIACGACSGFHCLVSSGTSSKQVENEMDSQYVGYGSMLLEGALAVIVILACCAGVGMGQFERKDLGAGAYNYQASVYSEGHELAGQAIVGQGAWKTKYSSSTKWADFKLPSKIGAFIEGGANFLTAIGIPLELAIGIIAVLVASFAATTLDTATRLQRYVLQELFRTSKVTEPLANKYTATGIAVVIGGIVAIFAGASPGAGGFMLWPLFGATNQLLAGLAFMVLVFYLWRRKKPIWFALLPMIVMLIMPAWAMLWSMFNPDGWLASGKYLLFAFGLGIMSLQVWMIIEAVLMWPKAKGMLEEALPPLPVKPDTVKLATAE
ncbi:MAG: carbon starvation protein A [Blastopirellula sp.]|nr:MAG: carbon starvation protein A [Blastopirellula sp.]